MDHRMLHYCKMSDQQVPNLILKPEGISLRLDGEMALLCLSTSPSRGSAGHISSVVLFESTCVMSGYGGSHGTRTHSAVRMPIFDSCSSVFLVRISF